MSFNLRGTFGVPCKVHPLYEFCCLADSGLYSQTAHVSLVYVNATIPNARERSLWNQSSNLLHHSPPDCTAQGLQVWGRILNMACEQIATVREGSACTHSFFVSGEI